MLSSAWCDEEERRGKQPGHSEEDRALRKDKDVLAVVNEDRRRVESTLARMCGMGAGSSEQREKMIQRNLARF